MSSVNYLASKRYPGNINMQNKYIAALIECQVSPAYHALTPFGDFPCPSEPLMEDDNKGWIVVKRKVWVRKTKTNQQLAEEAKLENWEDVEHYGQATYFTPSSYEHNGALFDIGSRF
jgi:hypothetical protein